MAEKTTVIEEISNGYLTRTSGYDKNGHYQSKTTFYSENPIKASPKKPVKSTTTKKK